MTGEVRWFIPALSNSVNDAAPLTITGLGEVQEGIEPLAFDCSGNQRMGHRIDLNGRFNGHLKIRRASFFYCPGCLGFLVAI